MTQLTIEGTDYPKTSNDKYKCYQEFIGESLRMISGRRVMERRAKIQVIEYSYDYFQPELMQQCLKDLRANKSLSVTYLEPESGTWRTDQFHCTQYPAPTFAFDRGGKPCWHNIRFKLESVEGVD